MLYVKESSYFKKEEEMVHVLYIEDQSDIGSWVTKDLTERGYEVTWLQSGEGVEEYLLTVDILILDVMLPGLDGFSIGKRIKKKIVICLF